MSFIKPIDLTGNQALRNAVEALISGKASRLEWSEEINLKLKRENGRAVLTITSGSAEVVLRGLPDPDFVKAVVYPDHAIVSLSLTDVRINY
jgi:hypothetical protein